MLIAFFIIQLQFFSDAYVFNIHIVFSLGDVSCVESSDSFTDYPHGLPLNCNK